MKTPYLTIIAIAILLSACFGLEYLAERLETTTYENNQ
jgi:hypothetical protein